MSSSNTQKRFRDRAGRLRRALASEKRRFGQIDDGAGKRYLIGPLYVLAGEIEQALAHYEWYERECSDDIGEPIHYLYWALALYRSGETAKAKIKLLETTIRNIYLLPALVGVPPAPHDMWHSSNREHPDYLSEVPEEFLPELSEAESSWIKERLDSLQFRRVKDEYISTHHALKSEQNIDKRRNILRRWGEFWAIAPRIDG